MAEDLSDRCRNCGRCGFCQARMVRLPSEITESNNLVVTENQEIRQLEKLARTLIEQKIRPEILREDVMSDLVQWLNGMLVGPAIPLNKRKNFIEDILKSEEFVADTEIFVESLPGCYGGLIDRNRSDPSKNSIYPDPDSKLRVREEILRNKCIAMVNHFARSKNVTDEIQKKKAVDQFYAFYHETITVKNPPSYNSYSGIASCMNQKFLKQSEDIVMYALGLKAELPEELRCHIKSAPPPVHTLVVFAIVMGLCVWTLPPLQSIDEYATVETFTSTIFKEGPFALPPIALGIIRLSFALICAVTTNAKINLGNTFKIVKLPGSKLKGGVIQMRGWRTQGFYTSWAWNLLGSSFFLGGVIPLLVVNGKEDVLIDNPWILRAALVSFEVAAPSALFTSFIVTYALWPKAYADHGASGTVGFKGWVGLMQHNANTAMVLLEVCLMGGLPILLSHASFAPIFAGCYQMFLWGMTNVWQRDHGPVFPYFFMDTTLGTRTTIFMMVLLSVIGFFFVLFAMLDKLIVTIEQSGHGSLPNVCLVLVMAYMLMKFKD